MSDPTQVSVTIFGKGQSDAEAERQVQLQQLAKYTVEERLAVGEIIAESGGAHEA